MTMRSPRRNTHPLAFAAAISALVVSSLGLAADSTPIDKASSQVSEALTVLKDVKLGSKASDEHLEKARTYLARARAELLKAQGSGKPGE